MKISEYETKQSLSDNNLFLMETSDGTRTILAKELASALLGIIKPGDLKSVTNIAATDKILIGTSAGIKTIPASDALFAYLDSIATVEMRRNIFRGKQLGTSFTSMDANNIYNNFKGQFLGDYWLFNSNKWRIIDFNYFIGGGSNGNETTKNHLVLMTDDPINKTPYPYNSNTNNTVSATGYLNSNIKETLWYLEDQFMEDSSTRFMLYDYNFGRDMLITSNDSFGSEWYYDDGFDLPNEIQLFGSYKVTPEYGSQRLTNCNSQFSLMNHYPVFINPNRKGTWLRDIDCENNKAIYLQPDGLVVKANPSLGKLIRPYCVAGYTSG